MEPSESSSDSWDNDSTSTPQTVLESENVYVTHEKARGTGIPYRYRRQGFSKSSNLTGTSLERDDSDDDGLSSAYPSKIDSYSTINDFSSSISSIKSWKNQSLSSCANDSVDNFYRAGAPSFDRSLQHKPVVGRRYNTPDIYSKPCKEPFNTLKNYPYLDESKWPGQSYYGLERQNPEGSDSNLNVTRDTNKGTEDKNNENKVEANKNPSIPSKSGHMLQHQNLPQHRFSSPLPFPGPYASLIASRFGEVRPFKMPLGHHTGPIRNPECSCSSCRRYFENK